MSRWVRDIALTEEQRALLHARNPAFNGQLAGSIANAEKGRRRRAEAQAAGRARAATGDPLFVAGCMLYWAEGDKSRCSARLSNSDPALVKFFGRFLRECFDVADDRFRVTCNLFADHLDRQSEVEHFWLDLLGLPRDCLCKSIVNSYSKYSQKKRANRLPYGTVRVAVHDTVIVQTIYGGIQAIGGFTREEWLD